MRNAFVTAGAALVLGGLGFTGPAQAVPPLSRSRRRSPAASSRKTSRIRKSSTTCYPDLVPLPSQVGNREGDSRTPPSSSGPKAKPRMATMWSRRRFKEDGIGAKIRSCRSRRPGSSRVGVLDLAGERRAHGLRLTEQVALRQLDAIVEELRRRPLILDLLHDQLETEVSR